MIRLSATEPVGLRGIVSAAILTGLLILIGAAGLMLFAASRVDAIQAEREAILVERRLERMQARMIEDVTSAAVWDDAVVAIQNDDRDWMQMNFGDYYADYMDHQTTLVLNGEGRLITASVDSEPAAAAAVQGMLAAARPLVADVMAEAARPERRQALGLKAAASASTLVRVGDQAYQLVAVSVVPEEAGIPRAARDPIVVSARPISTFVESLRVDLALERPRYGPSPLTGPGHFVLRGLEQEVLGHVSWTPNKPGMGVIAQSAPVFAGLLILLIAAAVVLLRRLDAITRRLSQSETALVEARDRAVAASQAKSRFLANMSHELRTPLNGVMGMAEIMSAGELSPIQRNHMEVLKASGQDLLGMIEHILTVTQMDKVDPGRPPVEFCLADLLLDVVEYHRPRAEGAGLTLTLTPLDRDLRHGCADQLSRILSYLLDNAITFTHQGEITVAASLSDTDAVIAVRDTGIGIDAQTLGRIFEPFTQADESPTRAYEGVGLGLSICHRLVTAMGGRITVDSAPGNGSTFSVHVPVPVMVPAQVRAEAA